MQSHDNQLIFYYFEIGCLRLIEDEVPSYHIFISLTQEPFVGGFMAVDEISVYFQRRDILGSTVQQKLIVSKYIR